MNCKQCGAPMKLIRQRAYHHCEHCGAYHFPDPDQDGIRVLGPDPDKLRCPQCRKTLHLAVLDDFYHGRQCPNCRGLLFDRTSFRDIVDSRRAVAKAPAEPFSTFDPSELDRRSDCPVCGKQLETFQYLGPGNIVIDTCHQDDLIWLDYGELKRIVNAPGRDRGMPRRKPAKDDQEKKKPEPKQLRDVTLIDVISAFFDQRR